MPDEDVLGWARRESRILMTFDKDFGEMAFRSRLDQPPGVILFRIRMGQRANLAARIQSILEDPADWWTGHFAVVGDSRVRLVPLRR